MPENHLPRSCVFSAISTLLRVALAAACLSCVEVSSRNAKPPAFSEENTGLRLDINGYWQDVTRPEYTVAIERERLVIAFRGKIQEAAKLLRASKESLSLCQFGRDIVWPLELDGSHLILHARERNETFRLQRLQEKPAYLAVKPFALAEPMALPEEKVREIERELARRLEIDQELRRPKDSGKLPLPWRQEQQASSDVAADSSLLLAMKTAENTAYIRELISEVGWIDGDRFSFAAANAAFLLVQHSEDIQLMLVALPWIKEDAKLGRTDWEPYTLLYDRLQLRLGEKQRYGTQIRRDESGQLIVLPVEDESRVDERREEVGLLPLAQYVKIFGASEVSFSSACR